MERHVLSSIPHVCPGHAWPPLRRYTFPKRGLLPCQGRGTVLHRASSTCNSSSRVLIHCALQFDCDDQLSFSFAPRVSLTRGRKELVLNAQISGRTVDRHGTLPKGTPEVNGLWFDRQSCHPTLFDEKHAGSTEPFDVTRVITSGKLLLV